MIHSGDNAVRYPENTKGIPVPLALDQQSMVYTTEKQFKFSMCDKEFSKSHNLKHRVRTHTAEKSFRC